MKTLRLAVLGVALVSLALTAPAKTRKPKPETKPAPAATAPDEKSKPAVVSSKMLQFVLTAESGTLRALDATEDTYSLQLDNVSQKTLYFTNRPRRITEQMDTTVFLKRWIKPPPSSFMTDPPNAALVFHTVNDSNQSIRVLELMSPQYDRRTDKLVFIVKAIDGKPMDIRASLINPVLTFSESTLCGVLGAWGNLPGEPMMDKECHQQEQTKQAQVKQDTMTE